MTASMIVPSGTCRIDSKMDDDCGSGSRTKSKAKKLGNAKAPRPTQAIDNAVIVQCFSIDPLST